MTDADLDLMLKRVYFTRRPQDRDFFYHADDRRLKILSRGAFPFKVKTTHPVIILHNASAGLTISPCSRGPNFPEAYRFIEEGVLERTRFHSVPEAKTYLIEDKTFPLPKDPAFWNDLTPHGQVPADAIKGTFSPEVLK